MHDRVAKLRLHRETIRELTDHDQRRVRAGTDDGAGPHTGGQATCHVGDIVDDTSGINTGPPSAPCPINVNGD